MNILLKFDFEEHMVYVPDGYVSSAPKLQSGFFDWMYDSSEYIIQGKNNTLAFSYDKNAVLKYINDVILCDSREKAYFIQQSANGDVHTLKF